MRRALVLALLLVGACKPDDPRTAAELGGRLFADPGLSTSQFNAFSCATCHSAEPEQAGPRIAVTLRDAAFRPSWWGGYAPRLLDAVNFCFVFFMRGEPFSRADLRGRALYEYLVSISPTRPAPAAPLTAVEIVGVLPRGDRARGAKVWDAVCRGCHGDTHSGDGRLNDLVAIVPEASIEFAQESGYDPDLVVIEKVRHGQFFGVGGNMPLFSREALSDADLGALISYLGL